MLARWKRPLFVAALALGLVGEATAELGVEFGVESFRWREFDDGERLLEESGPRYRIGATWRQPFGADARDSLLLRGVLYFGRVDYDGQACTLSGSCIPFQTDADYAGALGEARFSHRVGASGNGELFAGGGIDTWERDVKGRDNVSGAVENWTVFYLFAGGGRYWNGAGTRYHAELGAKLPFYTHEVAELFDVALEPKGRASLFARLATDFVAGGKPRWGLGLYYDSYRFDASDVEQVGSVLIWQPASEQDLIGLYAVVYLN